MEEIIGDVIEAGLDVIEIGAGSKDKGCLWMTIVLILVAVGVTLYFIYK
jgi:hypothetical protein